MRCRQRTTSCLSDSFDVALNSQIARKSDSATKLYPKSRFATQGFQLANNRKVYCHNDLKRDAFWASGWHDLCILYAVPMSDLPTAPPFVVGPLGFLDCRCPPHTGTCSSAREGRQIMDAFASDTVRLSLEGHGQGCEGGREDLDYRSAVLSLVFMRNDDWPEEYQVNSVRVYAEGSVVPEPASLAIWSVVVVGIGWGIWRRRGQK